MKAALKAVLMVAKMDLMGYSKVVWMVVLKVGPKAWKLAASSAAQMVAWMVMTKV